MDVCIILDRSLYFPVSPMTEPMTQKIVIPGISEIQSHQFLQVFKVGQKEYSQVDQVSPSGPEHRVRHLLVPCRPCDGLRKGTLRLHLQSTVLRPRELKASPHVASVKLPEKSDFTFCLLHIKAPSVKLKNAKREIRRIKELDFEEY